MKSSKVLSIKLQGNFSIKGDKIDFTMDSNFKILIYQKGGMVNEKERHYKYNFPRFLIKNQFIFWFF